MAKNNITYRVSMEQIKDFASHGKKKLFRKFDFSRLRDPDYRKYVIRRTIIYFSLAVFCTAFLLLLSASTSPLYTDYCDGDSSIFMLIGKAITMGKDVYRDYFDHKGPILFYLNALGFYLTGTKTGVFIIQCIMLSLSAIFMYKTARIFTKTVRSVICVIITILAFSSTISDGNLSEEYCMLFCLIPIFLAVRFYTKTPDEPHPARYMVVYGVCFAVCAFIRINNGIMIGGIVLIAIVTDFINENIRHSFMNILYFLLGLAIVTVPICIFFIIKGTFVDMMFATFVFNALYASEGSSDKSGTSISLLLRWALPILVLILMSTIFAKRLGAKVASLITTISVFALIPILMGFGYTHYYTTFIPLIMLYIAIFFFISNKKSALLSVILCIILALPLYSYFTTLPYNISHYSQKIYRQNNPSVYKDIQSDIHYSADVLSERIPENERNSVFGYDVSAAWFLHADIMPCYRIFTLQESWLEHYPKFGRQINQMLMDTPPKWIVIHNIDIVQSRQFLNILKENYDLDSECGYDLLYRHK